MKRKNKHYQWMTLKLCVTLIALNILGCTSEQQPIPDECEGAIILTANVINNANCGQSDGSFEIIASGGTGDYNYRLNGGNAQSGSVFSNLAAGSYVITITDELSCTNEITVNIPNQDGVNASISNITDSECENPDGNITITATGGVEPYEYKLDDNAFQGSNTFSALGPGQYTVTVKDASGCEISLQAEILSDVVFAQVKSIIQTNCAVSGCHNGNVFPDLRNDNNIASNSGRISTRTASRSMPPSSSGRSLSSSDIAEIACWVNDGANLNQ